MNAAAAMENAAQTNDETASGDKERVVACYSPKVRCSSSWNVGVSRKVRSRYWRGKGGYPVGVQALAARALAFGPTQSLKE